MAPVTDDNAGGAHSRTWRSAIREDYNTERWEGEGGGATIVYGMLRGLIMHCAIPKHHACCVSTCLLQANLTFGSVRSL